MIPLRDSNPTHRVPIVTYTLLVTNVAAFVYAKLLGPTGFDALTTSWGVIPFELTHGIDAISPTPFPVYATVLSSMFMHAGWLHIGGNMLYLWVFGNNVEDVVGRFKFLVFYLLCGLVAALAQVAVGPESIVPMIGASGAVAGALGAYMVAFPGATVYVLVPIFFFIRIFPLPAIVVLLMWFGLQLLYVWMEDGAGGGVAFHAHIGGFVAGMLIMRIRIARLNRI